MENVDINLYSRQLGVIDLNTMKKLNKIKVLILGLRGLGVEVAKNIILAGPQEVAIYDSCITKIEDLNSNYFLRLPDVSKNRRDAAVKPKLAELNSYVLCRVLGGENREFKNTTEELQFILESIKDFDIIIVTEFLEKGTILDISEKCRNLNKGFIYSCALGLSGFVFDDFGEKHTYNDSLASDTFFPISNIKKGRTTIISIIRTSEGFPPVKKGSIVQLIQVNGINEINNHNLKVLSVSESNIELDIDTSRYDDYINGGYLKPICENKLMEHKVFKEVLLSPIHNTHNIGLSDFLGRKDIVHSIILALYDESRDFEKNSKLTETILPNLNDEKEARKLVEISRNYFNKAKVKKESWINFKEDDDTESEELEEFDEEIAYNISLFLKAEIPSICSFVGGVCAQESIKYSGKFIPLNQWAWFEFSILVKDLKDVDRHIKNSRYDDQIAIFGNQIQEKLEKLNLFLIGIGAAGSEYLKLFSLMGIGKKKKGQISITDFDAIEISNLNRQFLYRKEDVGKLKSDVSVRKIKEINDDINFNVFSAKVGKENEKLFNDSFWDTQDIIFNGVDNINARIYIDNKVTEHSLNLVDVGTLGVSSSCALFLSNNSISYNEFNPRVIDNDNTVREVGLCTMASFPNNITQCIEWSRDQFEKYFVLDIQEFINMLSGNEDDFRNKLIAETKTPKELNKKLKELSILFDIYLTSDYNKVIEYSFSVYLKNFYYKINNLLKRYPPNFRNEDGSLFYSGSKIAPTPINNQFNLSSLEILYIKSFSNLLADALNIQQRNDSNENIVNVCKNIEVRQEEIKKERVNLQKMETSIKNFLEEIKQKKNKIKDIEKNIKITPFSKDNCFNSQYDFIFSGANIRAENFGIPKCDEVKSMIISGKIVPSIATSNAVITGLASMQLYLLLQLENFNGKLELFRNYYINIGINNFDYGYPPKKRMHNEITDIPKGWSIWDMIIMNGPLTIAVFNNILLERYEVHIEKIYCEDIKIYDFEDNQEVLHHVLEHRYQEIGKINLENKKYLILNVDGTKGTSYCNMAKIKYIFQ